MRAKAGVVSLQALSEMKARSRAADAQRLSAGVPAEQIARENAFIPAEVARRARIVSIGRAFSAAAFEG